MHPKIFTMNVIELRDIRKVYQPANVPVNALQGVSLDIGQGGVCRAGGPSGSGKSTLMNTLGCLDRPTSGSYMLAGKETVALSSDERAEVRNRQIGFVFQSYNLLARTTALENVELPLLYPRRHVGRRAAQARDRIADARRLGRSPRSSARPQLSGGQQQRVAIRPRPRK